MAADLLIIGTGLAGYTLAQEFRKLDSDSSLHLITSDSGDYYSKPQLSTALAANKDAQALVIKSVDVMRQQLNATIDVGTQVEAIDLKRQVVTIANKEIAYQKLVLCLGAKPLQLQLGGDAAQEVLSVNDLQAYASWRERLQQSKRVAVIGSGLVGCEFAHDLLQAGYEVDVYSIDDHPLRQLLPQEISQALTLALQDAGVSWHFKQAVESVSKKGDGYLLATATGYRAEYDLVLSAVGLQANIALAKACGLETARGICANQFLQTSSENVYALGDCAEVMDVVRFYVAPILHSARALAKTLVQTPTEVVFPALPINVKTALCPVSILPPPEGVDGNWELSGQGQDLCARFINSDGQLAGFALTGAATRQRPELLKEIQS